MTRMVAPLKVADRRIAAVVGEIAVTSRKASTSALPIQRTASSSNVAETTSTGTRRRSKVAMAATMVSGEQAAAEVVEITNRGGTASMTAMINTSTISSRMRTTDAWINAITTRMTSTRINHSSRKEVVAAVVEDNSVTSNRGTTRATQIMRIDRVVEVAAVAVVKATIGSAEAAATSNRITMRIGRRPAQKILAGKEAAAATTGSATISRIARQVVLTAATAPPQT